MRSLFIRNSYLLSRPLGRFQKVGIKSPALNAINRRLMRKSLSTSSAGGGGASSIKRMEEHVYKFDIGTTVESAVTPPSAWFTHPEMFELDKMGVMKTNWTVAGRSDQVREAGMFFADELMGEPYVVVRDHEGILRAFYNVCRHHAAQLTPSCSSGCTKELVCPYHGWTYSLDGRLRRATRLKGIKDFKATQFGLVPIQVVEKWGFVFLNFSRTTKADVEELFKPVFDVVMAFGNYEDLRFVKRVDYTVGCNWKVFVDNYLDGGYHVPVLHKDLTTNLDISSYATQVDEYFSVQKVSGDSSDDRIGKGAVYAFIYPNFMINRYGAWMDTNLVLPKSPDTCRVIYDYYLESEKVSELKAAGGLEDYLEKSLKASDQVHQEDALICESVQKGLASSGYDVGRYAPGVEMADHQFHLVLGRQYQEALKAAVANAPGN